MKQTALQLHFRNLHTNNTVACRLSVKNDMHNRCFTALSTAAVRSSVSMSALHGDYMDSAAVEPPFPVNYEAMSSQKTAPDRSKSVKCILMVCCLFHPFTRAMP